MESAAGKKSGGMTGDGTGIGFRVLLIAVPLFLVIARLLQIAYFPDAGTLFEKLSLLALLLTVSFLWYRETLRRRRLSEAHCNLKKAYDELKESEVEMIAILASTEEDKDKNARGHSGRVSRIVSALTDELGIDEDTKKTLYRAGVLHDIGKIGVDDSVLQKLGKLTDEEWRAIRSHPKKAVDILEPLKFLSVEMNMILSHHERYDGKGYPFGKKGEEISREARILSVADAFDAMNSDRPYRKALSREEVLAELEKVRNTQLSGEIVDVFLGLLKKRPDLWER